MIQVESVIQQNQITHQAVRVTVDSSKQHMMHHWEPDTELVVYKRYSDGKEVTLIKWFVGEVYAFEANIEPLFDKGLYRIAIEQNGKPIEELYITQMSPLWVDGTVSTNTSNLTSVSTNPLTPDECYKPNKTIRKEDIKQMILCGMHYRDYPEYNDLTVEEIAESIFNLHTHFRNVLNEI